MLIRKTIASIGWFSVYHFWTGYNCVLQTLQKLHSEFLPIGCRSSAIVHHGFLLKSECVLWPLEHCWPPSYTNIILYWLKSWKVFFLKANHDSFHRRPIFLHSLLFVHKIGTYSFWPSRFFSRDKQPYLWMLLFEYHCCSPAVHC